MICPKPGVTIFTIYQWVGKACNMPTSFPQLGVLNYRTIYTKYIIVIGNYCFPPLLFYFISELCS